MATSTASTSLILMLLLRNEWAVHPNVPPLLTVETLPVAVSADLLLLLPLLLAIAFLRMGKRCATGRPTFTLVRRRLNGLALSDPPPASLSCLLPHLA